MMKLRNIALLMMLASSSQATLSFHINSFGGIVHRTAKDSSVIVIQVGDDTDSETDSYATAPGSIKITSSASQDVSHNINLSITADQNKKGFFGAILGELNKEINKRHFAIVAGAFFSSAEPKKSNLDFAIGAAGVTAVTNSGTASFMQRGTMLMIGPKFAFHHGKFKLGVGLAATAAAYKAKFRDISSLGTNPFGVTDFTLKSESFKTYGAMPFATLARRIGPAEISAFLGYNLSAKPKLKNLSDKNPDGSDGQPALSVMSQALYNAGAKTDGVRINTSSAYFGLGLSMKVA